MATVTLPKPAASAIKAWRSAYTAFVNRLEEAEQASLEEDAASDRATKLRPLEDAIQPLVFKWFPYQPWRVIAYSADLETEWQRFCDGENKFWWSRNPQARKANFREAIDEILKWREATEEADRQAGLNDASERYDAAWAAENNARGELLTTPAPDAKALATKLDLLFGPEVVDEKDEFCAAWKMAWIAPVVADAKRLAGAEG